MHVLSGSPAIRQCDGRRRRSRRPRRRSPPKWRHKYGHAQRLSRFVADGARDAEARSDVQASVRLPRSWRWPDQGHSPKSCMIGSKPSGGNCRAVLPSPRR
nr:MULTISPECIES: hypothetical protein [Agrobacterium tumefaciens complex]